MISTCKLSTIAIANEHITYIFQAKGGKRI